MESENPICSECGEEIGLALSVVDGFAPWLCLECSGATLADFGLKQNEVGEIMEMEEEGE
jgi:hypothetical protein